MSIIDPTLAARVSVEGVPLSADLAEPKLRTLDQVEDELTGVSLALYEEQLDTARLRLALKSAQRGRRELRELLDSPPSFDEIEARVRVSEERERLRARVAELEAERHSTNEALDDAVQSLRANGDRLTALEAQAAAEECRCPEPAPLCEGCPCKCHAGQAKASADKLTRLFAPTQALREDPHDSPLHHAYRIPHDLPPLGGTSVTTLIEPSACRWCRVPKPEHMQRWTPPSAGGPGWHQWEQPTDAQILARMKGRRAARKGGAS